MFDVFFGWRKASKCKKLIRRVQCRLKLLKNKRCSIVRQSRDDVAQLLRLGYEQNAYNRVEHIIKDEHILQVYDLLEAFSEFVVFNLPYIRKHRDCPNDINEAVSTLVFASARCGDLPELRKLHTLFSERYGQKFTKMAVELLPGNLVNLTIKENLTIKSVSDDDKYKLMDEIASGLHQEPLALEYTSDWQQQLETPSSEYHSLTKIQESQSNDSEMVPDNDICNECEESDIHASDDRMEEDNAEANISPLEPKYNEQPFFPERHMERSILEDSASENSSDRKPEEIIYLDDIEEFKYPIRKDGNSFQDQRVFVFKSSTEKKARVWYDGDIEDEKESSESSWISRKPKGIRLKKRSLSWKNRHVNDAECAIYYGISMNQNCKSYEPRHYPKKMQASNCSLEQPCYVCDGNDKDDSECPPLHFKRKKVAALEHSYELYGLASSYSKVTATREKELSYVPVPEAAHEEEMCIDHHLNKHASYLRTITLPPERPRDDQPDSLFRRSKSFPFQQPTVHISNPYRSPHVHPKLPDYDELAKQFMALKKAALQKQQQGHKQ